MKRSSWVWICLTLSLGSKSMEVFPFSCSRGTRSYQRPMVAWDPTHAQGLVAGVPGRALLQERANALAKVAALRGEDLVAVLHRDRGLERRRVEAPVQAVLGQPHADRRVAQDRGGHLAARLLELGVGHDARHQPGRERARRR